MKKFASIALALCVVLSSGFAFAETHDRHVGKHKPHHKIHAKHKMHHKAHVKGKVHTKATPSMPKTGMGGASN